MSTSTSQSQQLPALRCSVELQRPRCESTIWHQRCHWQRRPGASPLPISPSYETDEFHCHMKRTNFTVI
ncbi:hypothetical protein PBRA_007549 [Plasmodiophora brassicae]|uniref:Uncharacterized protein n=1 Tax=Plasmodiophora brassicae TaxID=37360 RepID=A0A0G4IWX1_PLABS|nr:hypothetical protein PBRA_007549 [Plasmodiophora brassicae]